MMYCRENKHILHKHYTEIVKERMHEGDHHLIVKHKALLPTFEDEDDDNSESKIDVGVDLRGVEITVPSVYLLFVVPELVLFVQLE